MRTPNLYIAVFIILISVAPAYPADDSTANAGRAIHHSGKASANTSSSAANSIAASGQATSAASAIPLGIGGAVSGSPDISELVQDFPVDFFFGVSALEAGIIIPSAELQKRLLKKLSGNTWEIMTKTVKHSLFFPTIMRACNK